MRPHGAYSITIHVCTMNLANITHEKSIEMPLSNEQDNKVNNTIIK